MNKILTISIASYNIEKFINNTLGSFVIKDLLEDIEVIVVNDGSKDHTSMLAHEFQNKYPDTFVVLDKENGGYGSTINASSRIARGKYFKTVDGDDWVDENGMRKLIKYLRKTDDDLVVTNFSRINDKTGKRSNTIFECMAYEQSFLIDDVYNGQHLFMQALAIKTDILKQMNLNITSHCFYTDIEYILTPLPYCNTISFLNEFVYMYRVAVNEQSMSVAGKKKHIDEQLKVFKKMLSYYINKKDSMGKGKCLFFVTILSEMYKSHITAILSLEISQTSKSRLLDIEHYLNSQSPEVYKYTEHYKTIKVLRSTRYLSYVPGSIAYKIYQKALASIGR